MIKHSTYLITLYALLVFWLNERYTRSLNYTQAFKQARYTKYIDTAQEDCYNEFNGTIGWESLFKSTLIVDEFKTLQVKGGLNGSDGIIKIDKIKGIVKESSKYNIKGNPRGPIEKDCQNRLYPSIQTKDEALQFEGVYYIPFQLSYDIFETSLITVWKQKNDELIEYVSNIENVIPTKYSRVLPVKRFSYNSKEFMVVKIQGAEEGESFEELYLYELENNRIVRESYLTMVSTYTENDTLCTSRVKINQDSIVIYKELWRRSNLPGKEKKLIKSQIIKRNIINR